MRGARGGAPLLGKMRSAPPLLILGKNTPHLITNENPDCHPVSSGYHPKETAMQVFPWSPPKCIIAKRQDEVVMMYLS